MEGKLMDTDNVNRLVGEQIRATRKRFGITQKELADVIGKSRPSLVNIEQGRYSLTVEELYKISIFFEMPIASFLPNTPAQQELDEIENNYRSRLSEWREKFSGKAS